MPAAPDRSTGAVEDQVGKDLVVGILHRRMSRTMPKHTRPPFRLLVCCLLAAALAGCGNGGGDGDPGSPRVLVPIPDKTVILTFDDASRSHLVYVAPLLKRHGFGATFFVTASWMRDQRLFLSWPEVAELHRMGFEVGSHSWTHPGCHRPDAGEFMPGELEKVEDALAGVGVEVFAEQQQVFPVRVMLYRVGAGQRGYAAIGLMAVEVGDAFGD